MRDFTAGNGPARLAGTVRGVGPRVLLLHGGPGLSVDYVAGLAAEVQDAYQVASYQQRGLAPSSEDGPFGVADHVGDAVAVLDALGWDRAVLVGHSWGGHLALHVAVAAPARVAAVLAVDPVGGVDDGGEAAFVEEIGRRVPTADMERAAELDERAERGEATDSEALESLELLWPAYFPPGRPVPTMPPVRLSVPCYAQTSESLQSTLPDLTAALPGIRVPVGFVVGAGSPIPVTASTDTAARLPGAWVEVVDGAGHFPWLDVPGSVRAALDRLTGAPRSAG